MGFSVSSLEIVCFYVVVVGSGFFGFGVLFEMNLISFLLLVGYTFVDGLI